MAYPDRDYGERTTGNSWGLYAIGMIVAALLVFGVMSALSTSDTNTVTNAPTAPPASTQAPQTNAPPPTSTP